MGEGQREATIMIHEMAFDPTDLRTLGDAFDEAWDSILTKRSECAPNPEMRLRLASVMLHLARDHQLGPDQIKATALRLLMHDDPASVATG